MHYGNIKYCDIADGEGVRTSLFVSGCRNHCKNCFNPETWDFHYGKEFTSLTMQEIIHSLRPDYIAGLSLLGGEPMEEENQKTVASLVRLVKETYPDKNIWLYTGYRFDVELQEGGAKFTPYTTELLSYVDIMVDGKFVEDLKDITLQFRGSSNQRIIDVQESLKTNTVVPITRLR